MRDLLENKVPYAMLGGQYEYGFNTYQSDGNLMVGMPFLM